MITVRNSQQTGQLMGIISEISSPLLLTFLLCLATSRNYLGTSMLFPFLFLSRLRPLQEALPCGVLLSRSHQLHRQGGSPQHATLTPPSVRHLFPRRPRFPSSNALHLLVGQRRAQPPLCERRATSAPTAPAVCATRPPAGIADATTSSPQPLEFGFYIGALWGAR